MYADSYSEEIARKLAKLRKKDPAHYSKVRKKMDSKLITMFWTLQNLHHDMKGILRVHIGLFVLVFLIDHVNNVVSFEDYDHHDNIYE